MENKAGAVRFGPRVGARRPPLSASRASILEALRDQPEPVTLAALVRLSGLHENTVREHLAGLLSAGLVRRRSSAPAGRGRPAWRYECLETDPEQSEYAALATTLSRTLAHMSPDPEAAAASAGEEWGRELAQSHRRSDPQRAPGAPDVVAILDELRFEPRVGTDRPSAVRLTRCPLLEAAHRHPEVVCAVHLGLVRGALSEYDVDPTGTELVPFAEPGACLLLMPQLEARLHGPSPRRTGDPSSQ